VSIGSNSKDWNWCMSHPMQHVMVTAWPK